MEAEKIPMTSLQPLEGNLTDKQVLELYHAGRIPYVVASEQGATARAQRMLPKKLRRYYDPRVMQRAIDSNLIIMTSAGRWLWNHDSRTLLAYFCGRMWCGDKAVYCHHSHCMIWKRGRRTFYDAELEQVFGVGSLRQLREQRFFLKVPNDAELIDSLFLA